MSNKNYALDDFRKMVSNLKEVLAEKKTDIVRDSAIKRFELCYDLAWKSTKIAVKNRGTECFSPLDCLKSAFQLKIIDHDDKWPEVVKDRNEAVHVYKQDAADKLYQKLPDYLKLFEELLEKLEKE